MPQRSSAPTGQGPSPPLCPVLQAVAAQTHVLSGFQVTERSACMNVHCVPSQGSSEDSGQCKAGLPGGCGPGRLHDMGVEVGEGEGTGGPGHPRPVQGRLAQHCRIL